jgi:hypothetical protein
VPTAAKRPLSARGASAGGGENYDPAAFAPAPYAPVVTPRTRTPLVYAAPLVSSGPPVRKTDRVARFQATQRAWSKDRFLTSGGATGARRGQNFHVLFAHAHANTDAEREAAKARAHSAAAGHGAAARKFVTPEAKRRDELRFTVRMAMASER